MLKILELTNTEVASWDAYVENTPDATFFHRSGWRRVLESAFGHQTYFLYASRDGEVEGVLPLVHVKSVLFGNTLSSTAFCESAGIVANSSEAQSSLRLEACNLAERLGVDALELRNRQPEELDWPVKNLYVNFSKEISADPEQNLLAIPRKQRAMVRKGIKAGLVSHAHDDWDRVYRVYAESVRNLGTPVFSRKLFAYLKEVFGSDCRMLSITDQGRDIAAVLSFYFRDQVIPYYGGSISLARKLKGNDFMYWELMRRSCEEKIKIFDYGRSKIGTGSYSFKKNWGFVPEPLYYQYYLVKSESMPDINPMNPKYQMFIRAWKKLPLPVANSVGPLLSKNLG